MSTCCPLGKLVCSHIPRTVKGGIGLTFAATLVVIAILGTLGKLNIPAYGQWPLYVGGGILAATSLMTLYFHCKNK